MYLCITNNKFNYKFSNQTTLWNISIKAITSQMNFATASIDGNSLEYLRVFCSLLVSQDTKKVTFFSLTLIVLSLFILLCCLITATKIRRVFHISKFFLTFFILFFIACNHTYIFRLFRFAWVLTFPVVVCSVGVPVVVVCPVFLNHTRVHARTYTRARGFLDSNF